MSDDERDARQLTVMRAASNYWVVRSGDDELSGSVTRPAAEAERELLRRLRMRAAQMRASAPRRPRAVQRPAR
jgi:hypothetical protein